MRRRGMRAFHVTAVMVVAVSMTAAPGPIASGDEVTVRDNLRRDAGGPLDLKDVSHGHRGRRLVHTLRTYDAWRGRWLRGRTDNIQLTFNRQDGGEHKVERVLAVDYFEGELTARMINVTRDRLPLVGYAKIERPSRTILTLVFPRRFLKRRDFAAYRWGAYVFYDGPGCESYCGDEIPRAGEAGVLHDLGS